MILQTRPQDWSRVSWVIFYFLGYLIAIILVWHYSQVHNLREVPIVQNFISICIGALIISAFFLVLTKKARLIGILIISTQFPIILYFLFHSIIDLQSFCIGIISGLFFGFYALYYVKFDWLAKISKYCLYIITAYFWITLFFALSIGTYTVNSPIQVFLLVVSFIFWMAFIQYLRITLINISNSDVLIFGSFNSGKSVFLAALNLFLNDNMYGENPKEILVAMDSSLLSDISLMKMSDRLKKGIPIRSTRASEFALYELSCKKWGFLPIHISSIDYAGGYTFQVDAKNFNTGISTLSSSIHIKADELKKNLSSIQFLNWLKDNHFNEFIKNINEIGNVILFHKLKNSGKVIFLIDGEIYNKDLNDELLNDYLSRISILIDQIGTKKEYCFVITKGDSLNVIGDYVKTNHETSSIAKKIETVAFKQLYQNNHIFKGIINKIDKHPIINPRKIHCYLISVDSNERDSEQISGYKPWRIRNIANYIMKF